MGLTSVWHALFLILFVTFSSAVVVTVIDNFTPAKPALGTATNPTNVVTVFRSTNGNDTIGIERDSIIVATPNGFDGKPISSTIAGGSWSASFGANATGWVLLQYDGFDNSPNLSLNPGIGQPDLTQGDSAFAFFLELSSDLPGIFQINVYGDVVTKVSSYQFLFTPPYADDIVDLVIPFSLFTGTAVFTDVRAIEILVNVTVVVNAIDSNVRIFGIFGYQLSGNVFYDCNSNGTRDNGEVGVVGATVTLFNSTNNAVQTITTDANGNYVFVGISNGTFSICVNPNNAVAVPTIPTTGCIRNIPLQNATDGAGFNFGYFIPTVITPPPPVTVECGSCILPFNNCTGAPTTTGCSGSPVVSYVDRATATCPQIITRTFFATGAANVTQTITVNDTIIPVVVNNQNVTTSCAVKSPTISNWVSNHAFATVTDCTNIQWTSSYNNSAAPNCGAFPVTFTATDQCNNKFSFTNYYNTFDSTSPVITRGASNQTVTCNLATNTAQNTYTLFLSSHANATATDDCTTVTSLIWQNDGPASLTQGCKFNQLVNFVVSDSCGNTNTTSSIFTVVDNQSPTITVPAQNVTVPCNSPVQDSYSAWVSAHGYSNATDNCNSPDLLQWTDNAGSSPTGCNNAIPVRFNVTDPCGNSAFTTASFTIVSSTGPTLVTPAQPLNIDCSTNASTSLAAIQNWLDNHGGAVALDNCTALDWSNDFGTFSGVNCLGIPVTFSACNLCTPQQCVFTTANITLTDTEAPTFRIPPQPKTVNCDAFTELDFNTWLATGGNATVRDNCIPAGTSIPIQNNWPTGQALNVSCNTTAHVTFYATDLCGNMSPGQNSTYTVQDITPPTVTGPVNISVECNDSNQNSYNNWLLEHGLATATDPCSNITWSYSGPSSIPKGCLVTQTVTFYASDSCQLSTPAVGSYTLTDNLPPRLTSFAQDLNETCVTNTFNDTLTTWLQSHAGATAVDDCTDVKWSNNFAGLNGGCEQSALVVFVASDECHHSVSTSATYTLIDGQPPIITNFAEDTTVPCDKNTTLALQTFLATHGGATATDACQPSTNLVWSNDFATAPTQCHSILVTFSVTDGCGRYAYTAAHFNVTDSSAPLITQPARNVSVECDGYGNTEQYNFWLSTHAGANAFDFCAINVTWTNDAPPVGPVGCGTQGAVFTVTDGCNNFNFTGANFTVVDTTPPTIFPLATSTVVECDGYGNLDQLSTFLETHGGAIAYDICYGADVTWIFEILNTNNDSFSCTNFTTYRFTAIDGCGQNASTTASFGITDDGKPTVISPPQDLVIECGSSNNASIATWLSNNGGFVVFDNCSSVTYTNDFTQQSNPGFGCFILPVTFSAEDFCGHTVSMVANLVLQDTIPPSFVNFPADLTLPCDVETTPDLTGTPGVTDACFSNLEPFVDYFDTYFPGTADPNTPLCPANDVLVRTWFVSTPCNTTYAQNQTITIQIGRSSGPCDDSNCVCDNECCPQPTAVDCLPVDCLPQNCAAVQCDSVPCSCGFNKRDLGHSVAFENSPIPQCEPIYIHVADDDDDSVSLTVGKATLNNYIISDKPISKEELDKIKNKKVKSNKLH